MVLFPQAITKEIFLYKKKKEIQQLQIAATKDTWGNICNYTETAKILPLVGPSG